MYILNHFEIILYQSAIKLTQDKLCSINKDIQFTRDFQMLIGPSCMVLNLGNDKGETKFKQARYVVFANNYTFSGQIPYRMKELYLTSPFIQNNSKEMLLIWHVCKIHPTFIPIGSFEREREEEQRIHIAGGDQ